MRLPDSWTVLPVRPWVLAGALILGALGAGQGFLRDAPMEIEGDLRARYVALVEKYGVASLASASLTREALRTAAEAVPAKEEYMRTIDRVLNAPLADRLRRDPIVSQLIRECLTQSADQLEIALVDRDAMAKATEMHLVADELLRLQSEMLVELTDLPPLP